ncbi:MAG: hypothetical protein WBS24_11765 [Terriglobales bacterium]
MNLHEGILRDRRSMRAFKAPVLVTAIGGTPLGKIRQLTPNSFNLT